MILTIINVVVLIWLNCIEDSNGRNVANEIRIAMKTVPEYLTNPNRLLDIHNFEYIIPKNVCKIVVRNETKVPDFVVLMHTSPLHFELRKALRETWFHSDQRFLSYFVLGKVTSKTVQKQLNAEDAKHHDIIQANFMDTYHNLTYKHTTVLKWFVNNCKNVDYLVKMDDDVFMNVPEVLKFLAKNKNKNDSVIGLRFRPIKPDRWGKWRITQQQLKDNYYPEFSFGPSTIYSKEFVHKAYRKAHTTRFFWVDDIFVSGFIRLQLHAKITDIGHRILNQNETNSILTNQSLPFAKPDFMFSWNERFPDDIRTLWKQTHLNQ